MEENLLVDGFGKENTVSDERKKLYELFMKKKAMANIKEKKPLMMMDGFASESGRSRASQIPDDQRS